MPTGYTQLLFDKPDATPAEFIMRCARAMGACVMMREEPLSAPIPEKFTQDSTYHADSVKEAKDKLNVIKLMKPAQVEEKLQSEYEKAEKRRLESYDEAVQVAKRFKIMREQITKWSPPTPKHQGLKDFMLQQLDTENEDWSVEYHAKPSVKLDAAQWLEEQIEQLEKQIAYHTEKQELEDSLLQQRNEWIAKLREALPPPVEVAAWS
jgi:hypothetical protein